MAGFGSVQIIMDPNPGGPKSYGSYRSWSLGYRTNPTKFFQQRNGRKTLYPVNSSPTGKEPICIFDLRARYRKWFGLAWCPWPSGSSWRPSSSGRWSEPAACSWSPPLAEKNTNYILGSTFSSLKLKHTNYLTNPEFQPNTNYNQDII